MQMVGFMTYAAADHQGAITFQGVCGTLDMDPEATMLTNSEKTYGICEEQSTQFSHSSPHICLIDRLENLSLNKFKTIRMLFIYRKSWFPFSARNSGRLSVEDDLDDTRTLVVSVYMRGYSFLFKVC